MCIFFTFLVLKTWGNAQAGLSKELCPFHKSCRYQLCVLVGTLPCLPATNENIQFLKLEIFNVDTKKCLSKIHYTWLSDNPNLIVCVLTNLRLLKSCLLRCSCGEGCVCNCRCLRRSEESLGSPGARVTDGYELPDIGTGNQTLGPLQEQ